MEELRECDNIIGRLEDERHRLYLYKPGAIDEKRCSQEKLIKAAPRIRYIPIC